VVFLHEGEVVAVGAHRELLHTEPRYRAVVTRETDDEVALTGSVALKDVLHELEEIEEKA
jgi:hypothetical protein